MRNQPRTFPAAILALLLILLPLQLFSVFTFPVNASAQDAQATPVTGPKSPTTGSRSSLNQELIPIAVAPNQPTIGGMCGIDNDTITPAATQPEGVNPDPEISGWVQGTATLTYTALDGYYFPGHITNVITVQEENTSLQCFASGSISVPDGAFQNISLGDTIPVTISLTLQPSHGKNIIFADFWIDSTRNPGAPSSKFLMLPITPGPHIFNLSFQVTENVIQECADGSVTLEPMFSTDNWADQRAYYYGTYSTYHCSVSPPNNPEPTAEFTFPEPMYQISGNNEVIGSVDYDISPIWPDNANVDVTVTGNIAGISADFQKNVNAPVGTDLISFGGMSDRRFDNACVQNDGVLQASLSIEFFQTDSGSRTSILWNHTQTATIPCTLLVFPVQPSLPTEVCGPNNNILNIPGQTEGVLVDTGEWVNGKRTVTYSPAAWAEFPENFKTSYTYTDDQPCGAIAAFGYPESLPLLQTNSSMSVSVNYDLTSIWPENGIVEVSFTAIFVGENPVSLHRYVDTPEGSQVLNLNQFPENTLVNACVQSSGRLPVDLSVEFIHPNGTSTGDLIMEKIDLVLVPCSVLTAPKAPETPAVVCGPNNDSLSIPTQPDGVILDTGEWQNGQRTVKYTPAAWAVFPEDFQTIYTYTDNERGCDPQASIIGPETLYFLQPDSQITVTIEYDLDMVWPQDAPVRADFYVDLDAGGGAGVTYSGSISIDDQSGELGFTSTFEDDTMPALCNLYGGYLPVELDVQFRQQNHTGDWTNLWLFQNTVTVPCTSEVSPLPPVNLSTVCGPNNDRISVPDQPRGVIVKDTGWADNRRTITYSPKLYAIFPEGTKSSYTFEDEAECEATASITGPTSLYLLDENSQLTITGEYDVSSIWPKEGSLTARIDGVFETQPFHSYFSMPLPISSAAGSFIVTPQFPAEWFSEHCPEPYFNGDLEVFIDITFYQETSPGNHQSVWLYEQTLNIPCTVAVTPLQATVKPDVCGYIDQRINVPAQTGITGHSISWDDNIATITYHTAKAYEIVGGPYTVTVTGDPCITNPVPVPYLNPACGIENDEVVTGEIPEGVFFDMSESWTDGVFRIWISPLPGWVLPEGTETEHKLVDKGNCIVEGLTAPVHSAVCGELNDTVEIPGGQEHLTIDVVGDMATDGIVTVTFTPDEHYQLPDGINAEYTFTDAGNCIVTPIPPEAPVAVCGPNNDILTIPDQPEGVIIEDSGWVDNERTLTLLAADGYVFPDGTPRFLTSIDENIECEEDPVGTTLVVIFQTSDNGSVEGASYQLFAPVASQTMADPYIEGVIGPGNQIVFEEVIAGAYRLVSNPEGYEPIDVIIEVSANEPSEVHQIAVAALQPEETPTQEPTTEPTVEPTSTPTIEPTLEPTEISTPDASPQVTPEPPSTSVPTEIATESPENVTGLPSTGSGSGTGFGILAIAGLLAAMVLGTIGRSRSNP